MNASERLLSFNSKAKILQLVPNYSVPRYTSYPTALNFNEKINSDIYESWLKKLDKNKKISLYIHIPFCNSLCYFCGCHTSVTNIYDPIENYVKSLLQEINILSEKLESKFNVSHIHFGGGTPSILMENDLWMIMNLIKKKFDVSDNCEIAMEIDPRFYRKNLTTILNTFDFNRVSLGVQDFSQNTQMLINRVQSYETTKKIINHFHENNIHNVNIDLMYGLPEQTVETFSDTLEKIGTINPSRVSVFGYGHVPWVKKHQKLIKGKHLDNESRLKFYQLASHYFLSNGYEAFGIDHYAKKTSSIIKKVKKRKLKRNFQGYSEDSADVLIGIGASSISNLPNGYVQNTTRTINYINTLKNNKLPISRGYEMRQNDKIYREIINELMCYLNVDLNQIAKKFGKNVNFFSSNIEKLKPFIDSKYIFFNNSKLFIDPEARPLVRIICSIFDQYFKPKKNMYSFGL